MRRVSLVLAVATGLGLCGTALADLDTSNAYTDGSSKTWIGSTPMANGNLSADVDWVVNAPVLQNGKMQFEYLYQVKASGSLSVSLLAVGLLPNNAADEALGCGSFQTQSGDIAPTNGFLLGSPPSSANWSFVGLVGPNDSYALNYWSIHEPCDSSGYIQDGGLFAGGIVPCPSQYIPEPATLGVLALGLVVSLIRRRRP